MSEKYLKYKIEDWIIDDDFIQYVNGAKNKMSELIPSLSENSEAASTIAEAQNLLLHLSNTTIAVDDNHLSNLFDQINSTIDQKLTPSASNKQSKVIIRSLYLATALAASIALVLMFNPFSSAPSVEYATTVSDQKSIALPDKSIVEINNVSSISFDEKNWAFERVVTLEGEAFFKVEKGSKFTVKSSQGEVSVLGTQFNIYDRDGLYAVTCTEGRVQVNLKNGEEYILTAGDQVSIKSGQKAILEKEKVQQINWMNQFVEFENVPLVKVLEEVARYYDVEFENIDDLTGLNYQGFFTTKSLDSAMYMILYPYDKTFSRDGNKVIIK